uniref:Uncharacterized protein n=1 Tax=Bactrocera dorsalis TaxID=27457 RepID=A0A034WSV0_BACDO
MATLTEFIIVVILFFMFVFFFVCCICLIVRKWGNDHNIVRPDPLRMRLVELIPRQAPEQQRNGLEMLVMSVNEVVLSGAHPQMNVRLSGTVEELEVAESAV